MNTKIYVWILIVLILIGGLIVYTRDTEVSNVPDGRTVVSGTVTEVDLEGVMVDGPALLSVQTETGEMYTVAVPSMGLRLCPAFEHIADPFVIERGDMVEVRGKVEEGASTIVPCDDADDYVRAMSQLRDDTLGYAFTYTKGPDGYVALTEEEMIGANLISAVSLVNRTEYESLQDAPPGREGPPSISVRVYENSAKSQPSVWVMENPNDSNIKLAQSDPIEEVVGGANAVFFVGDGLYPFETYIVAHNNYIYVLTGMYFTVEDAIYQDFQTFVETFEFIPTAS